MEVTQENFRMEGYGTVAPADDLAERFVQLLEAAVAVSDSADYETPEIIHLRTVLAQEGRWRSDT